MSPLRYARFAARIAAANLRRPRAPYKLLYSVTHRCNYRCRTCGIWRLKPGDELSLPEIRTFFERNPGLSWAHLTGGEVFLRKDFVEIAEAIVRSSRRLLLLNFPTNGFLTERIVEGVRRIRALGDQRLFVTVSTDGDETVNDDIRGVSGGWRRQIETFRQLRAIPGVGVALGMTLSRFNMRDFPRAFAAASAAVPGIGYEDFHVNIVHTSAFYGNQDEGLTDLDRDAMREEVERYRRLRGFHLDPAGFLEWAYLRRVGDYLRTGRTPLPCHALRDSCYLDPTGNVYPCSMWDRPLGNLREHGYDLGEIWNAPQTLEALELIRTGNCPHCWTPCEAYQSILGNLPRLFS
jgi:MoaA/NifB/PqqE/SkfB family radical SAM enzyme